jgi:hypothetical protein
VPQYQALIKNFFSAYTNGGRPDPGDQGGEYRSFIGLPGGIKGGEQNIRTLPPTPLAQTHYYSVITPYLHVYCIPDLYQYVLAANKALAPADQLVLKEGEGEWFGIRNVPLIRKCSLPWLIQVKRTTLLVLRGCTTTLSSPSTG